MSDTDTTTGHTVQVADDGTVRVECHEPSSHGCRTEIGTCLVEEQAEDTTIEFAEYYGGVGARPTLTDGMRISVHWDGECYEWLPVDGAA